ncbi:Clp protease N-terminal domain-containing protein [Streptomyces phytohabitans]|uniref:Clp protease N-terminal domain-containing protein n=1 Tax=Streptomyces phytohabitans TaxID=1150371 RepID=UPI00345C4D26
MNTIKPSDWNMVGLLGAARGARGDRGELVGTEHLLVAMTAARGAVRQALADEGLTRTTAAAIVRERDGKDDAWRTVDHGDAAGVASTDVLGEDGEERVRLTGAAADAVTAAMGHAERAGAAKLGVEHLLRALLEEDNRAGEVLALCGTSPRAVRARLDGTPAPPPGGADDPLPTLLHPTREVLLGRAHYQRATFWRRWLLRRIAVNWASRPAWWVRMETYEQAHRLGARPTAPGTEHVLLAVLATYEVALRYPHLTAEDASRTGYEGGRRLAEAGLDHATVHAAVAGGHVALAADARPVAEYLDETERETREGGGDPGTGPLVERLLREPTRAGQLFDALGRR